MGRASRAVTRCLGVVWLSPSNGSVMPASGARRVRQRVVAWVIISLPPSERWHLLGEGERRGEL